MVRGPTHRVINDERNSGHATLFAAIRMGYEEIRAFVASELHVVFKLGLSISVCNMKCMMVSELPRFHKRTEVSHAILNEIMKNI